MLYIDLNKNGGSLTNDEQTYILSYITQQAPYYSRKYKTRYYDIICSFDIESTSTYHNNEKCAFMYVWGLCIDNIKIVGRTWDQFISVINLLKQLPHNLIIWVHNLSFEFNFICHLFDWDKVFALEERRVCYCTTKNIQFRCSFILSGCSLAKTGELYCPPEYQKKTGDLDYNLIRHYKTPLSDKEINYLLFDVMCVQAYIQYELQTYKHVSDIPLTKTSKVRKYCKDYCLAKKDRAKYFRYKGIIDSLTLEPEEYKYLKNAFAGGFTHGSWSKQGKIINNVSSYDLCSAYPAQMLLRQFPMSKGIYFTANLPNTQDFCYVVKVGFYNIITKFFYEHIISKHKCIKCDNPVVDNGRIISADYIEIYVTDIDLKLIKMYYDFEKLIIYNGYKYRKNFLPESFRECVLKFYNDKTVYKGVESEKDRYMLAKENLNSCYGMSVTDICRPEIIFDGNWTQENPDISKQIDIYNNSKTRFLSYAWGVWVTAYTREIILTIIHKIGSDYIYSDTDSIKAKKTERVQTIINDFNNKWMERIKKTSDVLNINPEVFSPLTPKGVKKTIGLLEYEGDYEKFKFLRAKCYGYIKNNVLDFTVAGINHKPLQAKIKSLDEFSDGVHIESNDSLKLCHTYIDDPFDGDITDYTGKTAQIYSTSGVHLEPIDFQINIDPTYSELIKSLYQKETSTL